MLTLKPENYRNGSVGPTICVEIDDGYVALIIESQPGETFDDRELTRALTAAEARALAAALVHFADEAQRPR